MGLGAAEALQVTSTRLLLYVASVLSLYLFSSCTQPRIRSQPYSGVLGSLRTRSWADAESPPPLSLLPILAAWPHPVRLSH